MKTSHTHRRTPGSQSIYLQICNVSAPYGLNKDVGKQKQQHLSGGAAIERAQLPGLGCFWKSNHSPVCSVFCFKSQSTEFRFPVSPTDERGACFAHEAEKHKNKPSLFHWSLLSRTGFRLAISMLFSMIDGKGTPQINDRHNSLSERVHHVTHFRCCSSS